MQLNLLTVQITDYAADRRNQLLDDIAIRFNMGASLKVDMHIERILAQTCAMPYMWPETDTRAHGTVRKAVIDRLTIILYSVRAHQIVVHDFVFARTDWRQG